MTQLRLNMPNFYGKTKLPNLGNGTKKYKAPKITKIKVKKVKLPKMKIKRPKV